jgi:hypothetical protein
LQRSGTFYFALTASLSWLNEGDFSPTIVL